MKFLDNSTNTFVFCNDGMIWEWRGMGFLFLTLQILFTRSKHSFEGDAYDCYFLWK